MCLIYNNTIFIMSKKLLKCTVYMNVHVYCYTAQMLGSGSTAFTISSLESDDEDTAPPMESDQFSPSSESFFTEGIVYSVVHYIIYAMFFRVYSPVNWPAEFSEEYYTVIRTFLYNKGSLMQKNS